MSWWWLLPAYWLGRRAGLRGESSSFRGTRHHVGYRLDHFAGLIAALPAVVILLAWGGLVFFTAFGVAWIAVDALIVAAGVSEARQRHTRH